jgi:predicted tellurium resistance membrane protein TerC
MLQVFGITTDPFIVYSSNMFAILSLRALYGFVNTIMSELKYLDKAVALVLGFIGAKMVADFGGYHVPTTTSLGVVVTTLAGGVAASLWLPSKSGSKQ